MTSYDDAKQEWQKSFRSEFEMYPDMQDETLFALEYIARSLDKVLTNSRFAGRE
ncbi:hypothetical protein ACFRFH_12045 [Leifsonia sp. NPDC056824]|uniref:hypothetical protein n=1 Tax=Leifsonia sp. NPDC056824 TaxID=3345953 RepID=UPI00368E95C4